MPGGKLDRPPPLPERSPVTAPQLDAAADARYWPVPLLRAVPLVAMGLVITFVNDHSTSIGLQVFGIAAIVAGALLTFFSGRYLVDPGSRSLSIVQGVVSLVLGVVAIALRSGGIPALVGVVIAWGVLTGSLEIVMGLRRRRRSSLARDWIVVGALTLVLVLSFVLTPSGYAKELGGIEKIQGTLTSSTILVGFLGAYGVLVGVFLVIQGLSLRWQTGAADERPAAGEPTIDGAHRP